MELNHNPPFVMKYSLWSLFKNFICHTLIYELYELNILCFFFEH